MNGLMLRAVLEELGSLRGRRVRDVASKTPWEVHIRFEEAGSLVACVHPAHAAIFPSPENLPDSQQTGFARSLGARLQGSRLVAARQAGIDRIAALAFEKRDRLGDTTTLQAIVELTGKGGNVVAAEGADPWGAVVRDRLREDRSGRDAPLASGSPYALPPSDRVDCVEARILAEALRRRLSEGRSLGPAMAAAWTGTGPFVAETLARIAGSVAPDALAEAWMTFREEVRPGGARFAPCVVEGARGRKEALCFIPQGVEVTRHPTASAAISAVHQETQGLDHAGGDAARSLRQAVLRTRRGLEAVAKEMAEADEAATWRRMGESLLASARDVSKGADRALVEDHRSGDILEVPLDPALDLNANAERYFKRARKAARGREKVLERRRELEQRLEDLQKLEIGTPNDPEWSAKAKSLGVRIVEAPGVDRPPEARYPSSLRPRTYALGDGWEVLVGKNNRGNDVLTLEIARPGDTWMHADQVSGSHVVLRHHEKGKEPPREKVLHAAAIAAFHSKARGSSKVSVLITEKRHVRKPSRSPVGTVTVGKHKTIMVKPMDPDALEQKP